MKLTNKFKISVVFLSFLASFVFQKIFIEEKYKSDAIFEIFEPLQERNENNFNFDSNIASLVGQTDSSDTKYRIAALMDSKRFFNRLLENPEFSDILANEIHNFKKNTFLENYDYFHSNIFGFSVDARRNFYYVNFLSKDKNNSQTGLLIIFNELNSLYKEIDEGKRDELEKFIDNEIFSSNQLFKQELLSEILLSIKSKQALYKVYDGKILRMLDEPLVPEKPSYPSNIFLFLVSIFIAILLSCTLFYKKVLSSLKKIL